MYLIRFRLNDSVTPGDLPTISKYIDKKLAPTLKGIQGVRAVHAVNAFVGEPIIILDIKNAATLDRILASREVDEAAAPLTQWLARLGPAELLFDRPSQNVNAALTFN